MEIAPGDEDVAVKLDEAASELESEWLGYRGDSIVLDVADDYERHVTSSRARERELHEQIDPRVFDGAASVMRWSCSSLRALLA